MNNDYIHLIPEEARSNLFVGFNEGKLPKLEKYSVAVKDENPHILVVKELLSKAECELLKNFFYQSSKIRTKEDTVRIDYGTSENGIQRASFYDKNWSNELFKRLIPFLNQSQDNGSSILIGLNPLIRFIHYNKENHRLIAHYDPEIKLSDKVFTRQTIVVYLNDVDSGYTNMLQDTRKELGYKDSFESFPVIYGQKPIEGNAIIFPHYVFHESGRLMNGEEKIILTTELCYIKP